MKYFFMYTEVKEDTAKLTNGSPKKKTFAKSGRVKRGGKVYDFSAARFDEVEKDLKYITDILE